MYNKIYPLEGLPVYLLMLTILKLFNILCDSLDRTAQEDKFHVVIH
jgi:hypothetical protein